MLNTAEVWKKYGTNILQFVLKRVKDEQLAQDIVQDLFEKFHLKKHTIKDPLKVKSWLYRVVINLINDHHRSKSTELLVQDVADENIENNEQITLCLNKFIDQLPEKNRHVVRFMTSGSANLKTYAAKFKLTYSTVKSRFQRGKSELKGLLMACCKPITDGYGNIISYNERQCKCDCQ